MDINATSISIGSILTLLGIGLTVYNAIRMSKKDVKTDASENAVLKNTVETHKTQITELKEEVKELRRHVNEEIRRMDEHVIQKMDGIHKRIEDIWKHLMKKKAED